jgi:hypothetical protein
VVTLIRGAKGKSGLLLVLAPTDPETVSLGESGKDISGGLELNSGNSPATVTIDGGGRTIDMTGSTMGPLITVGSGVTLELKNITLKGLSTSDGDGADNNAALIRVTDGGTLVLGEGAVIRDNVNTFYFGGTGGGVTLTMSGGKIQGNTVSGGGGVFIAHEDGTPILLFEKSDNGSIIYGQNADPSIANKAKLGNSDTAYYDRKIGAAGQYYRETTVEHNEMLGASSESTWTNDGSWNN